MKCYYFNGWYTYLKFIWWFVIWSAILRWWIHEILFARLCVLLLRGKPVFSGSHSLKRAFGRCVSGTRFWVAVNMEKLIYKDVLNKESVKVLIACVCVVCEDWIHMLCSVLAWHVARHYLWTMVISVIFFFISFSFLLTRDMLITFGNVFPCVCSLFGKFFLFWYI